TPLRSGPDRRGGPVASALLDHPAHAPADLRLRPRDDRDRRSSALRRALCHDGRGPDGQHLEAGLAHVSPGLSLVEPRSGDGRRLRALRDHARDRCRHPPPTRWRRFRCACQLGQTARDAAMKRASGSVALHAVLLVGTGIALLPLAWMVAASLMPAGEASAYPPRLLPSAPTLAHYRQLWARLDVARASANSLGLALAITAVSLLLNSMAGYAFAKLSFRGRDRVFRGLLTALVIPAQVGMLPLFLLLHEMGLIDTYAAVVIPGLASVFGIFLVRQYALSIPDRLLDAARGDGARERPV